MRRCGWLSTTLGLACLGFPVAGAEPTRGWKTIETAVWLGGAYDLFVEGNAGSDSTPRLRIHAKNAHDFIYAPEGGLVKIEDAFQVGWRGRGNLVRSAYVFASPQLRDRDGTPLLVTFGWAFASDPGSLAVFKLGPSGVETLLSEQTFLLTDVVDLDGDSVPELVGKRTLSQTLGGECHLTYDPYAVFKLGPKSKFVYAPTLSRNYNIKHYAWAGPKSSEIVGYNSCMKRLEKVRP